MTGVLLTGATGFLGSRLLRSLLADGNDVVVLKRSSSDTWRIADLLGRTPFYDVDRAGAAAPFADHDIDVVIHAATSYGRRGESHASVLQANVGMPLALLEAADAAGARAFLNTDSFSNKGTELVDALAWYMLSKRQFRKAAALHARHSRIQFITASVEHMFGPDDDASKFIPTLIRAFRANEPSFALTPGEQLRDFVYVDDVVAAYLTVLEHIRRGTALPTELEIGRGEVASLREHVELLHRLCGSRTELRFGALPYRSGELMQSRADIAPLTALGWQPAVSVRDGLQRTIDASAGIAVAAAQGAA